MEAETIGQERTLFRRRESTKEARAEESEDELLSVRNTAISYVIRCAQLVIGRLRGAKKGREQGKIASRGNRRSCP